MELTKNENANKLFISMFAKAVREDNPFSPVSLFAEDIKNAPDDLAVAQALSLLLQYCVVYKSGPLSKQWQMRPIVVQKYKTGYYKEYGII
jgi:hypothetical protein